MLDRPVLLKSLKNNTGLYLLTGSVVHILDACCSAFSNALQGIGSHAYA